jgi:hypothetical protein
MGILSFLINFAYIIFLLVQPNPCDPLDPDCDPGDGRIPIIQGIYILVSLGIGIGLRFFQKKKV